MTAFSEPVLVFDIETVPDTLGARRLYEFSPTLPDADVEQAMLASRRAVKGTEFQPPHLQRVVAIACALRRAEEFHVWSLGDEHADEAELIQRFFEGVEKYRPILVSWNGGGFDLPVLHYRGLVHRVAAPRYWDTGYFEREAKWDNYTNRYQQRHTDLMDLLALYQSRNYVPLHEVALLCGFPGKLGMDGSAVAATVRCGKLDAVRAYCETDVLNTWLVYLRFQRQRGLLTESAYSLEVDRVRVFLNASGASHWKDFREAWESSGDP